MLTGKNILKKQQTKAQFYTIRIDKIQHRDHILQGFSKVSY